MVSVSFVRTAVLRFGVVAPSPLRSPTLGHNFDRPTLESLVLTSLRTELNALDPPPATEACTRAADDCCEPDLR